MSSTHTAQFGIGLQEKTVDMALFAADKAPCDGYKVSLCGILWRSPSVPGLSLHANTFRQ